MISFKSARVTLTLAVSIALAAFSPFMAPGAALADVPSQGASAADADEVCKQVRALVTEYYPKAKMTASGKSLHFEDKVKNEFGYYSGKAVVAPQSGGILGDVSVVAGEYKGAEKARLNCETMDGFHSTLLMAPYSAKRDAHLLARLVYPSDVPEEFKQRFKELVNNFNSGEDAPQAAAVAAAAPTSTTAAAAAAPSAAPSTATAAAAPSAATATATAAAPSAATTAATATSASTTAASTAAAAKETQKSSAAVAPGSAAGPTAKTAPAKELFTGAKLSTYAYPEGRFHVSLPGTPRTSYKSQAGLRMVDYSYPDVHGMYAVSYVILPGQANPAAINQLFDKLADSFVKTFNGNGVKQHPIYQMDYPGREIDMGQIKGKNDYGGRLRLFSVRRYVYVVGTIGERAWLNSPIALEFLSSFNFTPEPTLQEQMELARKHNDFGRQFSDDFHRKQSEFDEKFKRAQSDARKAQEHARAAAAANQ